MLQVMTALRLQECCKLHPAYIHLQSEEVLWIIIAFATLYLHYPGFSVVVVIKTKYSGFPHISKNYFP